MNADPFLLVVMGVVIGLAIGLIASRSYTKVQVRVAGDLAQKRLGHEKEMLAVAVGQELEEIRSQLSRSLGRCEEALSVVEQRLGYTRVETLQLDSSRRQLTLDFDRKQAKLIPMPNLTGGRKVDANTPTSRDVQPLSEWQKIKIQHSKKAGND